MKRRNILAIIGLVLCLGLTSACGNTATTLEPPVQDTEVQADSETEAIEETAEAKENVENKASEEKEAEEKEETEESKENAEEKDDSETEKDSEAEKDSEEKKDADKDSKDTAEDTKDDSKADDSKADDAKAEAKDDKADSKNDDIKVFDKPVTMYATSSVNVRKGPSTSTNKLGYLALNEEISVIGESKTTGWKQVTYKGETAYVHGSRLGLEKVDLAAIEAARKAAAEKAAAEQAAAQQAQAQSQTAPAAPAPAQAQAAPAPKAAKTNGGILFIGDSRTCQMRDATGGAGCGWVCQYGANYSWFAETGVPTADPMIGAGTKVVICMGVNDPGSIYSYARLVNEKAAEWVNRGARVYYVSLNPVDHPFEDKIIPIDSFNATMPSQLANVYWIDTYSVVRQGGYVLEDGIHYDAAGNIGIFNMIIGCLR